MKKFGEKFKEYKPLGVEYSVIPGPKIRGMEESKSSIKNELNEKVVVEVAPTANVYQIPPDQKDLSEYIKKTLSEFNYYIVELGLNVVLGREYKVPKLFFEINLKSDSIDKTDVVAYDIAPGDTTKYTELLRGRVKINLGVTKLLKFIPAPIDSLIPDLLTIEINPLEFEWGIDKYMIDACGSKSYNIYWKIYETETVQGFNPIMILRARKNVSKISASVRATYELKKASWFENAEDVISNKMEIKILPM